MQLPDEAVKEFKDIYKRVCGDDLSDGEARVKAQNFLRLTYLISTPSPKKDENDKK